jgi:hypothetical protein
MPHPCRHRNPRIQFLALILFGSVQVLRGQGPINVNLSNPTEDSPFQFQLRICRAGGDEAKELAGNHWGGGGSCLLIFGDTPLRPRLRLDLDEIPRQDGNGVLATAGLGMEGVLALPDWGSFGPVFSLGPTLQHWSTAGVDNFGTQKRQVNKLAARFEVGTTLGERATLTLGCLYGALDRGRDASIAYVALTFQM